LETKSHFERHIYFYLVISMICWGISWPSSKILTTYSDPYTLMFLKFFISSLALIPMLYFLDIKKIFSPFIIKPLFYATLFIIAYNLFFFYGLQNGFAGIGGIIVTGSNPIFTFIIVAFLDKITIAPQKKFALILGILGTAITINITSFELQYIVDSGNLLFLIASLSWSLVTIFSTKAKQYLNSFLFSLYLYLVSSLVSYFLFIDNDSLMEIFNFDFIFWLNLFFVTVITTGFATTFYFKASNILGAGDTSSFMFLVPLVAVLSSALLLGEIPTKETLLGGVVLIFSVWLINKKTHI
jgi:drug/metabolite transporter (DMT)-like permease